jgi:HK97 family phage major capsid protein
MSEEIKNALSKIETRVEDTLKTMNEKAAAGEKSNVGLKSELDALLKDHKEMAGLVDGLKSNVTDMLQKQDSTPQGTEQKSAGNEFLESDAFKAFKSGQNQKARFEVKATVVNSGNDTSRHAVMDGVQGSAFRRLTVMPTIDQGVTDSNIVYFPRETTWTNAADGQGAEGTAKAESTLVVEEQNEAVITVAHFIPVSKQALDDSSFLAAYLDRRMVHGVNNAVEAQIIAGTAVGGQISGWADGNSTVTSPLLTGNVFGLANKMKYEIMSADYEPAYFYFNPVDFAAMETVQRGAGDAAYVAASGAINYVNNGMTMLLWGLPVVVSNNVPAGTIYCKAREADMYASRQGTVIEMFEQDGTNVQKNLVTVRAEARGALLTFAPSAIRSGVIASIT